MHLDLELNIGLPLIDLLTFRWPLHLTEPTKRLSSAPSAAEVTRDTAGPTLLVSKARRTDITAGSGKDTHLPGETMSLAM